MDHLFTLLALAKQFGLRRDQVKIHMFADGRDSAPQSAHQFIGELQDKIDELGIGEIVLVIGRGWAMDRDNRWQRLSAAYDALVAGRGAFHVQLPPIRGGAQDAELTASDIRERMAALGLEVW